MINRFLAITWDPNFDGTKAARFMTAAEIIKFICFQDCHDQQLQVWDLAPEKPEELKIHGTHHQPGDNLYIKLTDKAGRTVIDGHGTDH